MKDVFKAAENRILAKRVRDKFTPKAEEVRKVRVLSSGVASVAGQVYNAETGGFRAGDIVEAVNVGTKGNAHYRARFGGTGTTGNGMTAEEVKRLIEKELEGFNQNEIKQVTSTIPTDTGSGDPSMTVTPEDNISATGFVGDTFTGSQVYTLTNTGTASLVWTVIKGRPWVTLSATTGTLAASASTTVTVSINATEAALLTRGEYIDLIIFNAVNA